MFAASVTALALLASCDQTAAPNPFADLPSTPTADGKATVLREAALPLTPMTSFGYSAEQVARAEKNGLRRTDLPSIGSGLTLLPDGSFVGITDRGPNEDHLNAAGKSDGKVFPLPEFAPSLVRFTVQNGQIVIANQGVTKLTDSNGYPITGLTNLKDEETPWESPTATESLAYKQNGLDTEGLGRFPDGRFITVDETSPSVMILSSSGQVLMRYTPEGKKLPDAGYPVQDILPARYAERRTNRGFENVSLSGDSKTAWVTLQSPAGDGDEYKDTRIIRTLKLDVTDPLRAKVTGEYLTQASSIKDYPQSKKQADLKISDSAWISGDKLLTLERANGLVKLFIDDLVGKGTPRGIKRFRGTRTRMERYRSSKTGMVRGACQPP